MASSRGIMAAAMPSLNARISGWDSSTVSKNHNGNGSTRITTMASISGSSPTSSSSFPVPKLEPFSRSRSSHWMKEPSLLEKAKHALSDECVVLDGDESYRCWQALFEFENIKEAYEVQCNTASPDERHTACQPLERLENFVRQSGGVSTLIDNLSMLAESRKRQGGAVPKPAADQKIATSTVNPATTEEASPKIKAPELEQPEQSDMMPDSPFTRLLRRRGLVSSWFSPCPEH